MIQRLRAEGHKGAWLTLLGEVAALAGPSAELLWHEEKAWDSAMFSGAWHTIALGFLGIEAIAAGEAYVAALPDHEFPVSCRFVAEAKVISVEHLTGSLPQMKVEAKFLWVDQA